MSLRKYNNKVIKELLEIKEFESNLSLPLIVPSDDEYVKQHTNSVLCIGQETNGWFSQEPGNGITLSESLERTYKIFLKKDIYNSCFWRFVAKITCENEKVDDIYNNIIWANTIICGKKDAIGTATLNSKEDNEKLKSISAKYLIFIIDYFNPRKVIFMNGPCNPYYSITRNVLKNYELGEFALDYVKRKNPCIYYDKFIKSYHPAYLNRIGRSEEVAEIIKRQIDLRHIK